MGMFALAGVPAWLNHIAGGVLYAVSAYLMVWLFCTKYQKEELAAFLIPKCRIQVKWAVAAVLLPGLVSVVYLLFPGSFVPSVLFASLHIIGMNFSLLSCLQVMVAGTLVGIMFSLIALEGHSVWNSAIVHAVWNMIIIGGGVDDQAREGMNNEPVFLLSYILINSC